MRSAHMASNASNDAKQQAKAKGRSVAPAKKSRAVTKQSTKKNGLVGWISIGAVLVLVAVIAIVGLASSSSSASYTWTKAPTVVAATLTGLPASSYDVNTSAPGVPESTFLTTKNQPLEKAANPNGAVLPLVLYNGAEFCPYCAAERWAIVASLSRFGTFSALGITKSSSIDTYPNTNTLTFYKVKYVSPYITFQSIEGFTNIPSGTFYKPLQAATKRQQYLINKYDNPPFVPAAQAQSYPWINFGNQILMPGPTYDPSYLQGLTWTQIVQLLNDPTNAVSQQILVSSNYISASVCHIDGGLPTSVCTSAGVKAAAAGIGLK